MAFSKILAVLVLCTLHFSMPAEAMSHRQKMRLRTRHQPFMNPAMHYYNTTGRDPTGKVPGNADDIDVLDVEIVDGPYNATHSGLSKRHPVPLVHKETILSVFGWDGSYAEGFLGFAAFFSQIVEPQVQEGKLEVPPGCRPVWASCEKDGAFNGLEYVEVCNYGTDSRVIEKTELYQRIWDMIIPKLWELAGTKRYHTVREAMRLDQSRWAGRLEWATSYPSIAILSSYLKAYSWPHNDPTMGVALYKDPPARVDNKYLQDTWKLKCGEFA
ncbi:hypothetical protein TWF102_001262 [Orbilia oligospora]|uniref:Enterotoxin n=1 Tax=Orbilia oligospora TaxID=2813651 RepID=A0A7C8JBN3_ORBOL|nr:hypothetical protein TWF102_001262 [Orbilia oligospora]KAF3087651.1 hypothetical protein TWF103_001344 [Orbilia oligospora]